MNLKKLDYNRLQTLVTAIKSYMRDNYLSLNGGIMTGGITTSATDFIKINNTNSALLKLFGGEYDNNIKMNLIDMKKNLISNDYNII